MKNIKGIIITASEIALIIIDYKVFSILGQNKNIKNKICH